MGVLDESWRGVRAVGGWFLGAPFHAAWTLTRTRTRREAQELLERRAQHTCARWGLRVEVSGEPPPPGKGCVVTYNETSLADMFALHAVMWRAIDRGSGADVFGRVPLAKPFFARAGIALVPRGNRTGTDRVLAEMVEAVKAGERVGWGAEGRFSGRDEVGHFKVGASLIAIRAQAPLVPVAFRGGHAAMPLGSVRARPGVIRVRFGAPLSTAGLTENDARALADRAQAAATQMYAELGT